MALRSILVLTLVALCATGCAGGQRAQPERLALGTPARSARSITLTRGSCEGICPDYSVTLHGSGHVEMRGGGGTVRAVTETRRIDSKAARVVFDLADSLRFSDLPPSVDAFCASHVVDRPLVGVALRDGEQSHSSGEVNCGTLRSNVYGDWDTVFVRGVRVPKGAFRTSPEMQKWARDNEDRFIRDRWEGPHKVWLCSPCDQVEAERVLVRDSLARRYSHRLYHLARAIDSATGSRAWARRNLMPWAAREMRRLGY